jgi:hypothetical protein
MAAHPAEAAAAAAAAITISWSVRRPRRARQAVAGPRHAQAGGRRLPLGLRCSVLMTRMRRRTAAAAVA